MLIVNSEQFFLLFDMEVPVFLLILHCFCAGACLDGWDRGHGNGHFVLYGVTLDALCFDNQESGSSNQTVKGKAAVGAHWVCIGSPLQVQLHTYRRGLRRCSFRLFGPCQSL